MDRNCPFFVVFCTKNIKKDDFLVAHSINIFFYNQLHFINNLTYISLRYTKPFTYHIISNLFIPQLMSNLILNNTLIQFAIPSTINIFKQLTKQFFVHQTAIYITSIYHKVQHTFIIPLIIQT